MTGFAIPILMLSLACAGKLVGCMLGGIADGLQWRRRDVITHRL